MTSLLDSLLNPSDSGPQAKTKQRDAYRPKPRRAKVGQRAATATRALERNARAVEAAGGQPDGLPTSQTETTEYAWEL
jgi:hypothetical protein